MAAAIAVGGFLGRSVAVLRGGDQETVQQATMIGGLFGLVCAVALILLDAVAG